MIAYYKTEVPFIRLVLFFILGISISILFDIAPNNLFPLGWLILILVSIGFGLLNKKKPHYFGSYIFGTLVYVLMILSGIIICNQHKEIYRSNHFSKIGAKYLTAYLLEEPKIKGDIARFNVSVTQNIQDKRIIRTQGKLLLAMRFDSTKKIDLHYGDMLLLKAKYKETEPAYNPAEFNYKRFLSFQQVYHQTFINQKETKKLGEHQGNLIREFALKFRERQILKFDAYLKDTAIRAVASTLILGYRAELNKDTLETYTKTGTMHVLSVSGMHVGIVVVLLVFAFSFLNKTKRGRLLSTITIIAIIWFYALITGFAPSIERAAIMVTFIMLAKARSVKANIFNVIAITAFIILITDPFALINVGFQLSFIAVAGIIYLQPLIYDFYNTTNKLLDVIWKVISVSIAAQISTAPISLYYFHQFPIYFIISNVFIFLPAILIMYFGLFFLIFYSFPPIAAVFAFCLQTTIKYTNEGLKLIENIAHANITQIWWGALEILLFYGFFLFGFAAIKRKKYLKLACICLLLLILTINIKQFYHVQQKQAVFFALRKNTAVALIKGKTAVLITDLKADEFTYQFSVKPYLDSCQINYIEWINPHLIQDEKLISFEGKKLKIINHKLNNFAVSKQDWLLLSSDKKQGLKSIIDANTFEELFIDGKNRDFVIEDLKNQAENLGLKPHVLKRDFAIEIKL
ncbi:ComEC/Rec2 family competence protein [Pedobacter sp. SD-b]|uniref:ComEC/Rec2 family competence protein n=1 Tax=Pedobacter segetis TaxID=2793069 RepID=A0ABS1BJH1_9SPHI|nr:ComEC/Rec2 family competence protein [Pedobacter segetis]MBK0383020.1 ComEC/Rec2 family competence protein [Pedobacter segetis]